MNLYGCLLIEKFPIGTCHNSVQQRDAHYRVRSHRFIVVTSLGSGCKCNAGYYVSKLLTPLSEWWCERGGGNFGNLIVHSENSRLHKAAVSQQFTARNAIVTATHPLYSPDLAPSDFSRFGHVKGLFSGESFEAGE
jgi:hypothetical protein